MRRPASLIACAAVGVLLFVCSPAVALPPADSSSGPPRSGQAIQGAAQPLPTLVPPPNDAFGSASVAPSLPFSATVNTVEATAAVDDPSCSGNNTSVWYAFTPVISAPLTVETFGSDYDTTVSAYTGTQGALTQVACNDDAGAGLQSQIRFPASAGTTYYFMVAGTGGGNLVFTIDGAPLTLVPLKTTNAQDQVPAADATHFAWSHYARRGTRFVPLLMQSGGTLVRVNRPNTHGWSGGFEGNTFVYQEVSGRQSNLQLYDVPSRVRSAPPAGVNTLAWEWRPTMSGDQLLFGRSLLNQAIDQVLLRDLTTGTTRVLDRIRWRNGINWPGQVNGNYAVWFRCVRSTGRCNVFMHDIAAGTTTVIPNPGRQQYSPSVASDGTVYFVRSRRGCGAAVQLIRRPPGGPSRLIASLKPGRDASHTYALENADGTTTVFFERVYCPTESWDVLKLVDP
jgi:hypothetical protein